MTIELIKALVKAQKEIKPPTKDGTNPMFKSKYVTLDSIYEAIRVPLANNGLWVSHSVKSEGSQHTLITTLSHVSGEKVETTVPMFVDKVTSQGFGSALTYARRYSICSLLSLPSDEDDDGNVATAQQRIELMTSLQVQAITDLIGKDDALHMSILDGYGVFNLKAIESKHFNPIVKRLQEGKAK